MYCKLFTSIYQGTLRGNSHGLLVFTNLLAHASQDGSVDIHPRAIAEEVGLTVDQVREALLVLESPDDESRSPENEGRRIIRMDEHRAWGWTVVNYVKYRAIRNEDDRKEQNRLAQQRWRERNKKASAESNESKPHKPQSAHTEAEAEAEAKTEIQKSPPAARVPPADAGQRAAKKCPESFEVTAELAAWAAKKAPGVDIQSETDKLRDHTFANARKDWDGTWRNWMRKAFEDLPRKANSESFRERDIRLAAERVRDMTGGLCHDRKATGEKPRELLPFERGYIETIEGEAHEQRRIQG